MRSQALMFLSTVLAAACARSPEPVAVQETVSPRVEPAGEIVRLDPALEELLSPDAVVEKIADGFGFIEGPVWVGGADDGFLLFSDIPGNKVYQWSEKLGTGVYLEEVLAPDAGTGGVGGSNGLSLDHEGRLILCEHGNRRVARYELDGPRTTLADRYDGKSLNSPNDIVFHSSGAAFFTDPPYGLPEQDADANKQLEWNGIYRLDPDGTVTHLGQQTRPNGIGLSPDETTLYVANSDVEEPVWRSYPVNDDLGLGESTILLDGSTVGDPGVPDGLAVDERGNLWATGPGGVLVIAPDGTHLGTVKPAEQPANAGFGNDGRTLYMTARTGLYRVRTKVTGLMPGPR